jgi:hypothetical protein
VSQNTAGHLLGYVRDTAKSLADTSVRGYQTKALLPATAHRRMSGLQMGRQAVHLDVDRRRPVAASDVAKNSVTTVPVISTGFDDPTAAVVGGSLPRRSAFREPVTGVGLDRRRRRWLGTGRRCETPTVLSGSTGPTLNVHR